MKQTSLDSETLLPARKSNLNDLDNFLSLAKLL